MASTVCTPIKSHTGIFSTRTAGGRLPLTPTHTKSASINSSPFTPEVRNPGLSFKPSKPRSREARESPKSNIAVKSTKTPRRVLELGVSDFALTGTGNTRTEASSKTRKSVRTKSTKQTLQYAGDRFIPNRSAGSSMNNISSSRVNAKDKSKSKTTGEGSHILATGASAFDVGGRSAEDDVLASLEGLSLGNDKEESVAESRPSPNTIAFQDSLANACGVTQGQRILAFKPAAPESSRPIDLRAQYNRPLKPNNATSAAFRRRVATAPERVLDAPGLVDDYYLNLLDWSSNNQVAIGLERNVYVWSAEAGSVSCLLETTPDTYVSSVKWSGDGAYVGVGLGTGEVQIWDVEEGTKLRSMHGHDTRVGVMGWNKHLLSTGARSGLVYNHDVRIAQHKVAELVSHTSEVCGLEWRADGAQLATGGNDNLVSIWDARSLAVPKFTKTNHKAAVKALAWCPWQPNLLATGGGSYDRHIHFWNSTSGARVNSIDTGSQVTSLKWSPHYREIVSTSGFPDNSLSIWSYPTLVRNVEVPAHESRVLHSCLSPDGQMLATAAADESLKFWKVFEKKAGASASGGAASEKAGMVQTM